MKETLKLIAALTGICAISGLVLAMVYEVTEGPIGEVRRAEKLDALNRVLPSYDNDPDDDRYEIVAGDEKLTFYVAKKAGDFAGAAFEVCSHRGYGGDIWLIVGVTSSNVIRGIEILEQTETPGLGAKIVGAEFRSQFRNKNAMEITWCKVRQDAPEQGEIDVITGASISSRAVADAMAKGLRTFAEHIEEISRAGERHMGQ